MKKRVPGWQKNERMKKCSRQGTQKITVRDETSKKGHSKTEKSTRERKKMKKGRKKEIKTVCSLMPVARMGEVRGVYRVLVGKPEGKRPLGRPTHRWVDNIRMDLQEVGCGYMDWIGLAQDRDRWRSFVSAVMNLRVP